MKKRIFKIVLILFLIFVVWLVIRFVIGGPEDDWICVNNQWVKHGNPNAEMPLSGCGEEKQDKIKVSKPQANETLSGTIEIEGEARGFWYFEASFPIQLIDENGNLLVQTIAQAQSDPATGEVNWMTENFVPFKARIEAPLDFFGNAFLIFKKDNPSGLPENEEQIQIPIKIEKKTSSRENGANLILYEVPFISQAPFGQWENPIYQNACEEAALLMAIMWVRGEKSITKEEATQKLKEFADFEIEKYNNFFDHSIQDTAQIMKDYFNYNNVEVKENITVEDIKNELINGNLVIVPINGQVLKNPFYTPPGPAEHMILIIGYDFQTKEFITNDAGTRHGEKYRYDENEFYDAIRDYPTGNKEPILEIRKPMIVIKPNK